MKLSDPKFKGFYQNCLLVFLSIFISLVTIEIGLRIFFPRYQEAAGSDLEYDDYPKRIPNLQYWRPHPDTGKRHITAYNNLGLRQSWDISLNPDKKRLRIGIFGDSFVENTGLSVEYGFVDVLDYLLNSNEDKFEVINFGMNGYGTDDCYLSFLRRPVARSLSCVFDLVSGSDLMRIYENKLILLDNNGKLIFVTGERRIPIWKKWVSKLYLTYLFLEAKSKILYWFDLNSFYKVAQKYNLPWMRGYPLESQRFIIHLKSRVYSKQIIHVIKIYQTILDEWSQKANEQHAQFAVVTLPFQSCGRLEHLIPMGVDRINLYKSLNESFPVAPRLVFYHDGHWNETGNMIAAILLYRYLEVKLKLPHQDDHWINKRLFEYYSAFDQEWFPYFDVEETVLNREKEVAIRNKYEALNNGALHDLKKMFLPQKYYF